MSLESFAYFGRIFSLCGIDKQPFFQYNNLQIFNVFLQARPASHANRAFPEGKARRFKYFKAGSNARCCHSPCLPELRI